MDLYSAFADHLETDGCFLHFHEMREVPNIHHPVVDLLASRHPAQSTLAYALRESGDCEE